MGAIFWAALAFFLAATFAGTIHIGVRAWRAWQAFVSLAVVGSAGLDVLAARSEEVAAKSERTLAKLTELQTALASLERARARGRVLLGVVDEVRDVVRAAAQFGLEL